MRHLTASLLLLTGTPTLQALDPKEVAVVVNADVPASREVADHFVSKRGVPKENIVSLSLPAAEDISRADYDAKLVAPLREALRPKMNQIKCLVTTYGVPLRVGPKTPSDAEKAEADRITKAIDGLKANPGGGDDKPRLNSLEAKRMILLHQESTAAVDSELMLLWWPPYPLTRWQVNPLYWQVPADRRAKSPPTLLTSRLDGPTPAIAMRLVDDALAAEATGLAGNAYVDARGMKFDVTNPSENGGYGYGGYDESMREAAKLLEKAGLPTTLDDKPDLFPANACPGAAVYCGWYALTNYRPCCAFVPGAVAWHLASGEATTLRDAKSKAWCPNLLAAGVAATLGPVAEPYTVGFPKPAEFYGFLLTGKYTLAEVHGRTQHFASWMTVLVGDPLYNPFGKTPKLKEEDVTASPKGGRVLFK